MRSLSVLVVLVLSSCAAHDEVVAVCQQMEGCGVIDAIDGCIGDREGNLGQIGGRCGDGGTSAALAIYACEAALECDVDSEVQCADELAAFEALRDDGGSCEGVEGPLAPN